MTVTTREKIRTPIPAGRACPSSRSRAGDFGNRPWTDRWSFVDEFERTPLDDLERESKQAGPRAIKQALGAANLRLKDVAVLLSKQAGENLEPAARRARLQTVKRFGRTIQLFAPLYMSSDCVSTCTYCGFAMKNAIPRRTLSTEEIAAESRLLKRSGFLHQLLVASDHPRKVSPEYLASAVAATASVASFTGLEVQSQDEPTYVMLKEAGCDGVTLYQETYDRDTYMQVHAAGPKRDMDFRLDAPDRAGLAGIGHMGIGVLLGLTDRWRRDVVALVAHGRYLQRRYPGTQIAVSLPRLKPAAGEFTSSVTIDDRDFLQAVCVLRMALPEAGIVLSTREGAKLRNGLIGIGVTHMSAGSRTEPGGYSDPDTSEGQFSVDDMRSPREVAAAIRQRGFEPVWKDWDAGLHGDRTDGNKRSGSVSFAS